MSTRANIAFFKNAPKDLRAEEPELIIYRHSDGYPEAVIEDIMPFLREFDDVRGVGGDPEYAFARLLQHLCNKYDEQTSNPYSKFLGYGIAKEYAGDTEYLYAVHPKGVSVHEKDFDDNYWNNKPLDTYAFNK